MPKACVITVAGLISSPSFLPVSGRVSCAPPQILLPYVHLYISTVRALGTDRVLSTSWRLKSGKVRSRRNHTRTQLLKPFCQLSIQDFSGGLGVKSPCFQCREHGFRPGWGISHVFPLKKKVVRSTGSQKTRQNKMGKEDHPCRGLAGRKADCQASEQCPEECHTA